MIETYLNSFPDPAPPVSPPVRPLLRTSKSFSGTVKICTGDRDELVFVGRGYPVSVSRVERVKDTERNDRLSNTSR